MDSFYQIIYSLLLCPSQLTEQPIRASQAWSQTDTFVHHGDIKLKKQNLKGILFIKHKNYFCYSYNRTKHIKHKVWLNKSNNSNFASLVSWADWIWSGKSCAHTSNIEVRLNIFFRSDAIWLRYKDIKIELLVGTTFKMRLSGGLEVRFAFTGD